MRLIALLLLVLALPPMARAAAPAGDDAGIEAVIEQFRTAIIDKDRDAFLATFLHDAVTWQAAMSDARHARALETDPQARKVVVDPAGTPATFIDGIVRSPNRIEETFADVVIDSDGTVASVAFDFQFLVNDKATNVGREFWLMVKTENGWKIAAVTWSRNSPPQ